MNSTEIFALGLGLQRPWYITDVSFESNSETHNRELHIYIDFERGYKFPTRHGAYLTAYDTTERTWQHLNFFQHRCFLHARVPRLNDSSNPEKNEVYQVEVPWARAGSGFTLLFEAYSMLLIENEMAVNSVAKVVSVGAHRLWRIFNYWIGLAVSKDNLSSVTRIGIDETSRKKGHEYITQVVDLDTMRTIFVTPVKDAETIERFVSELEVKKGDRTHIDVVSMDMSPAFISGASANFPNARLVFDKFHLVKLLNEALDEVRKAERKGNELLKGHRYTILKKYDNLGHSKKEQLNDLLLMYPKLGEAYRLREMFLDMFTIRDKDEAKGYLYFWCDQAVQSGLQAYRKFVNTIKAHWSGITAYFDLKVTNAVLEGINSKIQLAKRRARGFRNVENFINMIYFLSAKLEFDYPRYSS